jgi:hypothetical protein
VVTQHHSGAATASSENVDGLQCGLKTNSCSWPLLCVSSPVCGLVDCCATDCGQLCLHLLTCPGMLCPAVRRCALLCICCCVLGCCALYALPVVPCCNIPCCAVLCCAMLLLLCSCRPVEGKLALDREAVKAAAAAVQSGDCPNADLVSLCGDVAQLQLPKCDHITEGLSRGSHLALKMCTHPTPKATQPPPPPPPPHPLLYPLRSCS